MNHIIDPTYFYDAIAQFAFDYIIYHADGLTVDDEGKQSYSYTEATINGSLQSQGHRRSQGKKGNIDNWEYKLYCKSLYRIDIGDMIKYNDKYLYVDDITDYDEWGVREAHLQMVDLNAYRDFADWLKYQQGDITV